ncbi:uncharacterized protein LOC114520825 [Dendronephthya gigantea]|uniref:uncharacterized protein LOC114520825 n=1 Tax=Dendronephthya gigantea TaxID=151771 RepID=UPI00106A771C|nr:uncharacterized protein LOC114520825 [Dendronephthya gigantea]
MAFLPNITPNQSTQNATKTDKRREDDKKSGYRVSLANIYGTSEQSYSNVVSSCPSDDNGSNTGKRERLPRLVAAPGTITSKREQVCNKEESDNVLKPLKLPKCPSNDLVRSKAMFWIEPLGLWAPLKKGRRLYEKFSRRIDLLCKDPDYFLDPCPHIPRCDHSRSWSAVRLERQRYRELREMRNKELLEKTFERYQNMQELWFEQMNNRSGALHSTPSHMRLQNFRKSTGRILAPLDQTRRLERLQERQREWEEAWDKLASERRERTTQKKSPENLLPQIIVTEYEFVWASHDEHGEESCAMYLEESYQVICRQILNIFPRKNFSRTPTISNKIEVENRKLSRGLDNTENEYRCFNPSEDVFGDIDSGIHVPTATIDMDEPYSSRSDHSNYTTDDFNPADEVDSSEGGGGKIGSKTTHNSSSTICSISGASLDTVGHDRTVVDIAQAFGIKHADNTVQLMSQLVPAPLGVSCGKIPDPQMTASSSLDTYHTADQARLHNEKQDINGGAWFPRGRDTTPYLQVDLGQVTTVQQVASQGNPASAVKNERHKRWVTKFSLEFSEDGKHWTEHKESGKLKVFTGNCDSDSVVLNSLDNAVQTRFVRFRPTEWHTGVAMRVEVFGSSPLTDIVEKTEAGTPEDKLECSLSVDESLKHEDIAGNQKAEMVFCDVVVSSETGEFDNPKDINRQSIDNVFWIVYAYTNTKSWSKNGNGEDKMVVAKFDLNSDIKELPLRATVDCASEVGSSSSDMSKETKSQCSEDNISDRSKSEEILSNQTTEPDGQQINVDENEPLQPPTSQPEDITALQDPHPPPPPRPSPTISPLESWAQALERARSNGNIRRELQREKLAEERRQKLAKLRSKNSYRNGEKLVVTEDRDELGDFLDKYCIVRQSESIIYKNVFEKFDEDKDGFLWPEEVLEALENVNSKLLTDSHLSYVFRVLEQCDCHADIGIGFRLFSVIAALSQRVASLNDKMKKLIAKCDFKTLDCTLDRVKMLFECYVNKETMSISRTDLWIGLAAGGLRSAEATIDDYFSEKNRFDFLDFLTYLPLFQEIHGYVVENPLTLF